MTCAGKKTTVAAGHQRRRSSSVVAGHERVKKKGSMVREENKQTPFLSDRVWLMFKGSRISSTHEDVLPVELLQRVQSLLPLKDAASTCILSKSWLRAWYTIPNLQFILPEPDEVFSSDENETKYKKLIHTTLERYHKDNIPIESFHLQLRLFKDNLKDAENWIRLVVSKSCLKDLSLNIRVHNDDSLTLPNELFSSQNLITINVTNCIDIIPLRIGTNPVINYFCCSKGSLEDKILVPKPPNNCTTCGDPVDGLYCRPCAFVRKCLNEVIKKMMEWNKTDIKDVQLKNRYNGKWEALTSSWKSVLDTLPDLQLSV
ncbi:putative F-box/LRR-repeat protein isoform X2 [Tanacetum coccineum]